MEIGTKVMGQVKVKDGHYGWESAGLRRRVDEAREAVQPKTVIGDGIGRARAHPGNVGMQERDRAGAMAMAARGETQGWSPLMLEWLCSQRTSEFGWDTKKGEKVMTTWSDAQAVESVRYPHPTAMDACWRMSDR